MVRRIVSLGLLALASVNVQAAGDAVEGEWKTLPCMGCHGIPGYNNAYPTYKVPKLGGQHAEYVVAALKAYRAGQRSHKTMRAQAASLSNEDIEDIAAYLTSLPNE